jgi:hypothetical protein
MKREEVARRSVEANSLAVDAVVACDAVGGPGELSLRRLGFTSARCRNGAETTEESRSCSLQRELQMLGDGEDDTRKRGSMTAVPGVWEGRGGVGAIDCLEIDFWNVLRSRDCATTSVDCFASNMTQNRAQTNLCRARPPYFRHRPRKRESYLGTFLLTTADRKPPQAQGRMLLHACLTLRPTAPPMIHQSYTVAQSRQHE